MRRKQIIILSVVLGASLLGLIFTQAGYFQAAFKLKKTQFDYTVNKIIDKVITSVELQDKLQNKSQQAGGNAQSGVKMMRNMPMVLGQQMGSDVHVSLGGAASPIEYGTEINNVREFLGQNSNLQNSILKSRLEIQKQLGMDYDLVVTIPEPEKSMEERLKGLDLKKILADHLQDEGIVASFEYGIKDNGQFILTSPNFFNQHSDYSYTRKMFFDKSKSPATLFLIFPDQAHDLLSSIFLLLPSLIITVLLVLCFGFCIAVIVRQKKMSVIKNDFINNMTHEFKTPIATISLAAQMLKDGAVNNSPGTIDHIAGIIRDESKRLTFQVEKVLQTALFTETRMKLKLKNINLNEVAESLLDKFSLRIEDRKGQLYSHLEAQFDEVYADEVHITNVISNLLDNAIKYCANVPEISVYTRNKGEEIIISVIDNGIGIAAKEQKLIFERFYRVSTGNLHDVKGFGLGLSYVKTVVEAHGGRIEVESDEGKGSRFDVILPLTSKKQKVKRTLFF